MFARHISDNVLTLNFLQKLSLLVKEKQAYVQLLQIALSFMSTCLSCIRRTIELKTAITC